MSALIQTTRDDGSVRIGLDVSGPGGGQFTASVSQAGVHAIVRGLTDETIPVLHISNAEIADIVQSGATKDLSKADWDLPEGVSVAELSDLLLSALQPEAAATRV